MNKKIYYAHCMSLYNTKQEIRDVELLEKLGYEVVNPNLSCHQENCRQFGNPMEYFTELIKEHCEVLAFRALPDGKIPAGVLKEVQFAIDNDIPVFELPINIKLREMSLEQTRAYLMEVGQR